METRTFEEADGPAVVSLWEEVFAYPQARNAPAKVIRDKLAVQRDLFFVAVSDGRIVGSVMGGYDGHRGWVYSLAVASTLRGRGFGSALMKHAEGALTKLGCPKVNLQILSFKTELRGFYEKLGYQEFARLDYPPVHYKHFMRKRLTPPE